jgi:hypothetical protein
MIATAPVTEDVRSLFVSRSRVSFSMNSNQEIICIRKITYRYRYSGKMNNTDTLIGPNLTRILKI